MVLGPGDALRVHDREAEIEQELAEVTGEPPVDGSSTVAPTPLVLVPPAIELKLNFLVVRVLRAEHLPAMDTGGLLIGAQGIDAFVQVVFAANTPCKTSCVTVKGRGISLQILRGIVAASAYSDVLEAHRAFNMGSRPHVSK